MSQFISGYAAETNCTCVETLIKVLIISVEFIEVCGHLFIVHLKGK